jgi:hypothetical protein
MLTPSMVLAIVGPCCGPARLDMGTLSAPPGSPVAPDAAAEQALFMEARRRRLRRWLTGIATVLVTGAVVAVSAITWLPRASGHTADHTGAAAAALAGRSSAPVGQARITYRVVTAGVPEAYGTDDITFSGKNRSHSFSSTALARGTEPAQNESGTERIVDGQVYIYTRVRGRLRWIHELLLLYPNIKIIDPRTLLRVLAPYARFQATGYQVIGGARLKVLRATDPGGLTHRDLLPVMYTSAQSVASLEVWVDQHGVVHRMAFTFRAPGGIQLSKPVSKAALRKYLLAERAVRRTLKKAQHLAHTGKRLPDRLLNLALRRSDQAEQRAFPARRGAQVTSTTVTFSDIGQPQHITAPPHAISYRKFVRLTRRH